MIYVVIGRRELGKTTLARYLGHAFTPRIIVDPRFQWTPTETTMDDVIGEHVLEDLEDGQDVLIQPENMDTAIQALAWPARAYIIGTDPARKLTIVFDEAGLYRETLKYSASWSYIMRGVPRDRTSIILTAHRPSDIPTDIRALADVWCIFRTTQEHDLDVIDKRCGPEVVSIVQTLKPYEFVSWNDAKAEMQVHRNPKAWYTPAAAPLTGEPIRRPGLF